MRQVVRADGHDTICGSGTGTVQQAGAYNQRPQTCSWSWIKGGVTSTDDMFFYGLAAIAVLVRI